MLINVSIYLSIYLLELAGGQVPGVAPLALPLNPPIVVGGLMVVTEHRETDAQTDHATTATIGRISQRRGGLIITSHRPPYVRASVRQSSSTRSSRTRCTIFKRTDDHNRKQSARARASGDDDVTMTSRREERDGDVRARGTRVESRYVGC